MFSRIGVGRRKLVYVGAALGASLLVAAVVAAVGPDPTQQGTQTISLTEGTNIAATVSPDHRTIIMDLQGMLWSVPFDGGTATRLTDPLLEPARPDWSPKGDLVAFEAYQGGTFHIWVMKPDGSGVQQLTTGHGDDREPRFSPDGTKIAFSSDRAFAGTYDIWTVDVAGGALTRITTTDADEFEPTWSPDGTEIAFVSGTGANGTTIQAQKADGTRRTLATAATGTRVNSPAYSPDGTKVAYLQFANNKSQLLVSGTRVGTSDDVFPFYPQWLSNDELLYTADGKIRVSTVGGSTREIAFQAQIQLDRQPYQRKAHDFDSNEARQAKGIVGPALSPDGKSVAFQALNQIWVMEIGKKPRAITNDTFYKCDPAWSPDGKKLAYSSDKAGTEDLYVQDLATGAEQRITSLPGAEVSAAWAPGGGALAFQDQTGATFTVELATGTVRPVITALFAPGKPTWSKDGKVIAVAALKPYTRRFREGTSQILTRNLDTGAQAYHEVMPFESFSTRGEDGPVWSPDGTAMAAVVKSTLWIIPVDATGAPSGTPQQITHEVTDAPTWSGDSKQLLYLSNGQLKLVSRDGTSVRDVAVDLPWTPEQPSGRVVIHAGRLWDGRGPDVQTDVDVTVQGNRIVSIAPHSASGAGSGNGQGSGGASGARFVDASSWTVIPGLWESHTHEWISGKFFGDRLGRVWLAYGVTSLQSLGDPVYRAMETRESFGSGARVGPRYFATGEAIDGERVYYNFMRPVSSEDQLDLENARAKALDYDMVKTYVRLPHAWQKKVVDFAHGQIGVWTGSHYMLPGMAFGMDGMTHVSATTRLGFAYTRSSAGVSYHDMTDLFGQSKMYDISTTFNPVLDREDPGLVDDARLAALYPPWELTALKTQRDQLVASDPTVALDSLAKEEDTVKRIFRQGGNMLAGTDSPLDRVAVALHLNVRSQVHFGMQPWEALQTVTSRTAHAYGYDADLGTIEPGKLADMAFIAGNPLQNIGELINVRAVMKNGKMYTVDELMAPFQSGGAAQGSARSAVRQRFAPPPPADPAAQRYWWHDPAAMGDDCH